MKKSIEKLNSKKFEISNLGKIVGGDTTYGHDRGTAGSDCERNTYNPEGYAPGTQGSHDGCATGVVVR